jgi:geranylgeranyl reductase family protein
VFDVIVCGAGPAGSVAATVLARGGARVLLVDRARFPRDKLCGDTINPGTVAILRRLGLFEAIEPMTSRVDGMIVTGEHGVSVRCRYATQETGCALLRRDFDRVLMCAAAGAGARLEEATMVRGPLVEDTRDGPRVRGVVLAGRDGRDLRVPAPIVIAADGRRSRLAIPLGLTRHPRRPRRWAVGAYFSDVADVSTYGEMHVRRGRYVGIARVPSGLVNVCAVVSGGAGLEDPASVLLAQIARDSSLRERFQGAKPATPPVVLGPLAVDAADAGMPGLLLAGDAAGFIDPMTGDGLRFAVRGGELAGDVVLSASGGRLGRPYAALRGARQREFGTKWRFNRTLRRLVDRPITVELAGVGAFVAPWILQRAIRYAGDGA